MDMQTMEAAPAWQVIQDGQSKLLPPQHTEILIRIMKDILYNPNKRQEIQAHMAEQIVETH